MDLEDLTVAEAAAAIRAGTVSPVDYASALLARIDKIESRVQAWVTIDRDAVLAEAKKCEVEARDKRFRGSLHGIPLGIKDIFYTKNLRTTMGSPVFATFVPEHDARAVARLKQAGAIVLGKCVTTMFANLDPGPTRNPWNTGHTPGGSSSGSAAAVAARMCPGALGSQTLGSVGRPAAFNGVASLVPTQRRISLAHVFPLAWSLDHVGIFGRSVADLELMLDAMTEIPVEKPTVTRSFRIAVIRDFFYEKASAEARSANDSLADKLSKSGFQIEEVRLPAIFGVAQAALRIIVRSEAASNHEALLEKHRDTYGKKIRAMVETGMLIDAAAYVRARRIRRRYQLEMARLFEGFDAVMTPAAVGTAPEGLGSTGDPVMNSPWTLADVPIVTLPCALGGNGMPLAVQFSGPTLQEGSLLRVAKAVEAVINFQERPKL
jgi:Asp-tRNA(Asn)/Glu-tRNA(Gln) amidotransferase A subunit family amidase